MSQDSKIVVAKMTEIGLRGEHFTATELLEYVNVVRAALGDDALVHITSVGLNAYRQDGETLPGSRWDPVNDFGRYG